MGGVFQGLGGGFRGGGLMLQPSPQSAQRPGMQRGFGL